MKLVKKGHPPTNHKRISIDGVEYISMAEAARQLGLTYNTLQSRIKSGKIKVGDA